MTRLGRLAASCALLAALAACSATTDGVTRISYDPGGSVDEYAERIKRWNLEHHRVEMRGRHVSAGAMNLAVHNSCVAAGAIFGFHGPNAFGMPAPPRVHELTMRRFSAHLPPNLRSWYRQRYGRQYPGQALDYTWLSGADIQAIDPRHITLCQ